ncbi:hypothetical protein L6164_011929 [Bauhinia variegata]|uniref:Uncharacterized protein n=1 Tax=Bauhinia variegata TaxID=167791 RepID=A0ACB9P7U8_BAUVA|nr:hypothetical protein L6164_011929 [Bauhinia variegata]
MEEAKGVVKHIVLAKFKDEIPQDKIDELVKGYAILVNLIPPLKSCHWTGTLFSTRVLQRKQKGRQE